ncbi:MAG: hypothetical protein KAT77_00915 [Nanoarchaeota archaeon]|nr:hypothetical protein [Nanoarchaeota archaeon]
MPSEIDVIKRLSQYHHQLNSLSPGDQTLVEIVDSLNQIKIISSNPPLQIQSFEKTKEQAQEKIKYYLNFFLNLQHHFIQFKSSLIGNPSLNILKTNEIYTLALVDPDKKNLDPYGISPTLDILLNYFDHVNLNTKEGTFIFVKPSNPLCTAFDAGKHKQYSAVLYNGEDAGNFLYFFHVDSGNPFSPERLKFIERVLHHFNFETKKTQRDISGYLFQREHLLEVYPEILRLGRSVKDLDMNPVFSRNQDLTFNYFLQGATNLFDLLNTYHNANKMLREKIPKEKIKDHLLKFRLNQLEKNILLEYLEKK